MSFFRQIGGRFIAAAVVLTLAGCATSDFGSNVTPADQQKRQQAITTSDLLIVPGQRIGPIRMGMGIDEVFETLGHPDIDFVTNYQGGASTRTVRYWSLNLEIGFVNNMTPTVDYIAAKAWCTDNLRDIRWGKNMEMPKIQYRTATGIGLGSTAFEMRRAFSSYQYRDVDIQATSYVSQGISFEVTNDDTEKRIYGIDLNYAR